MLCIDQHCTPVSITGKECALLGEYAEQEMMAANFQSQITGE